MTAASSPKHGDGVAPGVAGEGPQRVPLALAGVAMFVLALNLRLGISSVGPVLPQVLHDLSVTVLFGSLLTTAPVIMMGVASPLGSRVADRLGIELTIVVGSAVVTVATLARLWAVSAWLLLLSALVLGTGIAAGNTMLPATVRRYFPEHTALMTGVYTVGINTGAASAALLTPQLAQGAGSPWRGALSVWAAVGVVAATLWMLIAGRVGQRPRRELAGAPPRSARAWRVAFLFGAQSMVYFGILAWLAPLYEERGWSKSQAGLLLALFIAFQVIGSMTAAIAVQRTGRLTAGLRITASVTAVGALLVGLTPLSLPWLWAMVLGLGAGGIFTLAMTVPLAITRTVAEAQRVTGFMLFYGYILAASGPFAVSVLHSISGGFASGFCFLAVFSALALAIARRAARRLSPAD